MSTHASIWTPRHTHKLWPKPKAKFQIKATPYVAPPPPPPLKKPPPPDEVHASAEFLETVADKLLSEANSLEGQKPQPGVRIQLGLYLLEKDDAIKGVLKAWDTKNKGEFLKGEFRLNLRTTGIAASSAEADDLFDSWDECVHCLQLRPPSTPPAVTALRCGRYQALRPLWRAAVLRPSCAAMFLYGR